MNKFGEMDHVRGSSLGIWWLKILVQNFKEMPTIFIKLRSHTVVVIRQLRVVIIGIKSERGGRGCVNEDEGFREEES